VAGASLSPGLTAMNDTAAAAGPFAKAAWLLESLVGVSLTVKRVERAAEASGAAQAAGVRERSALVAGRKVVPMPPQPCPDMLYGAIDGTGVLMTGKETAGRRGKGEDGRARTRLQRDSPAAAVPEAGPRGAAPGSHGSKEYDPPLADRQISRLPAHRAGPAYPRWRSCHPVPPENRG
jgi:hypothetical protein